MSRLERGKRYFSWLLFTSCFLIVLRNLSGLLHELGHSLLRFLFTGSFPNICITGTAWIPLSWKTTGGSKLWAAMDAEVLVTLGWLAPSAPRRPAPDQAPVAPG